MVPHRADRGYHQSWVPAKDPPGDRRGNRPPIRDLWRTRRCGQAEGVTPGRVQHLLAAAVVAVLAVTGAAPAAPPAVEQLTAPAAAAVTKAAPSADSTFELPSRTDPADPIHWLACRPIQYRVNPKDMPAGMLTTVQQSMAVLEAQTGVRFQYAGRTSHAFDSTSHDTTPTIYFAFTAARREAGQTFGGSGGEIGVGGPAAAWVRSSSGRTFESMVYGRVLLSSRFQGPRTGAGATWQSLILHEVGHALNLAHRDDRDALMNPVLTASAPGRYSTGEVAALRRVLQTSRCDYTAWSRL